jgi:mannosylglycerate hydrolase
MSRRTFHLIPHTHWDREWYLTRAAFVARLVPMMDDLLDRLDRDPWLRFHLDGQTVLAEDYLRVRPEQTARVAQLVREGRLSVGPWYVLADELIPSGESLVRNLLAGGADAERFGRRSEVLYSPDAFGHPAVLPAIAAEFGLSRGVLWRGLGGEPGQDRDFYRWRGPDGRELLLYHLPPDGYEIGAGLVGGGDALRVAWDRIRRTLLERAATSHVAVPVGADHHAIHPELALLRDHLAQLESGSDVRISSFDEFFSAAESETDSVATMAGELRWSYGYTWTLQGVHGTRARLKRRHTEAELWLSRIAEPLAALALMRAGSDAGPLLRHAWRTLLRSQFHDSTAGCTADAVARRVDARIEDAETMAREIARAGLDAIIGNDPDAAREHPDRTSPRLLLWNPVARPREGVVVADLTWFLRDVPVGPPGDHPPRTGAGWTPTELVGPRGVVPLQLLGRELASERLDSPRHYPDQDEVERVRVAFRAPALGGLGLLELAPAAFSGEGPAGDVEVRGRSLRNGLVELRIEPDGRLTLRDLRTNQRYAGLLQFESDGDAGDTYTYAAPRRNRLHHVVAPVGVRMLAGGPLVGALALRSRIITSTGTIELTVLVSLHAGSAAVRCTIELENRASDHRLRVRFPTGLRGGSALAGGPFGAISRSAVSVEHPRYPRETPVPTAPAHGFVARAGGERGLALLAPGFFQYELTAAGDLLVTLLRAVGRLSADDLPARPGHAGWPMATPEAQSQGSDRMQLAIVPIAASDLAAGSALPGLWEDVFLPLRGVWLRQATPLAVPELDLRLEGEGLVLSAVKPAEAGGAVMLRCYNATARPVSGGWRLPFSGSAAWWVRADEREPRELLLRDGGRLIPFDAGPHEIVTVRVEAKALTR